MQNKLTIIKNITLLSFIVALIGLLAFTLERSEINNIISINITGNKYLDSEKYLEFANMKDINETSNLNIKLIQDRLGKHPYIKNIDVIILERGIVNVTIYEKEINALLLSGSRQYLVTSNAEVLPYLQSTKNINYPVIVDGRNEKVQIFSKVNHNEILMKALKIITTAEIYDKHLCNKISEVNINKDSGLSINITGLPFPIYFGNNNEIAKTVYLSKVLKNLNKNDISNYLSYIDLRFDDLVYLGFKENLNSEKGKI